MRIEEHIILETPDFVIINKPSGMLTLPDRHDNELTSLLGLLRKHYGEIFTVHRLDRDTSGIILFARNEAAHKYYSQLFESREVKKFYLALVTGQIVPKQGIVDEAIMEHPVVKGKMVTNRRGKASLTDYEVLEEFGLLSLVKLQIHTGRTHQIRVHMKHLGHPVAVDEMYGTGEPIRLSAIKKKFKLGKYVEEERPLLSRLALHAAELEFKDQQGKEQKVIAPLPKDMAALLNQLRKHKS
ncbi:23S rRNA pseudouridine955/2504/2580 synthase/23S rRNA pseudouridine1911/1915/1917 synthase [Chitinophaga jiangningensis]|uniref:Pseudouridine synthase n=1 Tax=Chitinophaga jiangningensis TaxID=1419482 RepID=A0A1M7H9N2_9BACT|nr:RluA family pseudouridine synthase [Chitinophaga jiangningensis]SHM25099.1 23S rRNA pseudouridine955/2504/2580 synthase/23S rRNA pseudouridine1911/1915/1917 synthase [Chitinophaga jiangningensis]